MKYMEPESLGSRLINSLQNVSDLDALQSFFVSNDLADACPQLQRVLVDLLAAERARRDGVKISGYGLAEFSEWRTENLLAAGLAILTCCEVASLGALPTVADFGWRLLQIYFAGLARALATEVPLS